MTLLEKIKEDLRAALKEKREPKLSVLRLLTAAITNKNKEKRYKISKQSPLLAEKELEKESQLTDNEIIDIIFSEVKKRKEAVFLFEKGKRQDLAEKEKKELEILERYLPNQLSEEEIKKISRETIGKLKAKGAQDIGRVMAELMPKIKGKADGSLVSKIVKELLTS